MKAKKIIPIHLVGATGNLPEANDPHSRLERAGYSCWMGLSEPGLSTMVAKLRSSGCEVEVVYATTETTTAESGDANRVGAESSRPRYGSVYVRQRP